MIKEEPANLTIAQVFATYNGGLPRAAYNIAWGLKEAGVRSLCITIRDRGRLAVENPANIEIISLQADAGLLISKMKALLSIRKIIRKYDFNLLHIHGPDTLLFCVLAMRGMKRPILWFTWHNPESFLEKNDLHRLLIIWAMQHCQVIFGASQQIVDRIARVKKLTKNLKVFPNCVADQCVTEAIDSDKPIVLWMARFVPTKNPLAILDVSARLKHEGFQFKVILCGSPQEATNFLFEQAQVRVEQLGISDIISMPGWEHDVPALLRKAAIGVQTSYAEGLSITLLEQMMAGLAVVATDVGDTKKAVLDEITGLLIQPGDNDALTNALRRLLLDKELRIKLGNGARKIAQEKFNIKIAAMRVKEELMQLDPRSLFQSSV